MAEDPGKLFSELLETSAEIVELERRLAEQRPRRDELVVGAYALGVTAPALASATRLSETAIKAIIAEAGGAPDGRRQDREISAALAQARVEDPVDLQRLVAAIVETIAERRRANDKSAPSRNG